MPARAIVADGPGEYRAAHRDEHGDEGDPGRDFVLSPPTCRSKCEHDADGEERGVEKDDRLGQGCGARGDSDEHAVADARPLIEADHQPDGQRHEERQLCFEMEVRDVVEQHGVQRGQMTAATTPVRSLKRRRPMAKTSRQVPANMKH